MFPSGNFDYSKFKKKTSTTTPTVTSSVFKKKTGEPAKEEDLNFRDYAAMFVRGLSGFTPGGLIGAAAGGIGELAAQTIEGRDEYNFPQVATQSGLGAIPFGSAIRMGPSMLKGATMGLGGTLATQQAEEGLHIPRAQELPALGLGATLGSAGGGIASKLQQKALNRNLTSATAKRLDFEQKPVITKEAPIATQILEAKTPEVKLPGRETRIISQGGPAVGRKILEDIEAGRYQEPQAAKTEGGIKIGADIESLGKILGSSLYKGNIAKIATKELLQNSVDATRHLGQDADINVTFSRARDNQYVEVVDNGKGLTRKEIETVFTDLGSSGKREDVSAIGGFGLAKAAPLLGGKRVEVSSIVQVGNGKIEYSFSGTPDELIKGVKINQKIVSPDSITGVRVRTYVPEDADFYDAKRFVERLSKFSNIPGKIKVRTKYSSDYDPTPEQFSGIGSVRPLTTISEPQADYTIAFPESEPKVTTSVIRLQLLNNGMWQNERNIFLSGDAPNIPGNIVVDVRSKVPEGHPNYPFTANREELRGDIEDKIKQFIDDNIVNPARGKRKEELTRLYNEMPSMSLPGRATRSFHFYDPGNRLTPEELNRITTSPISTQLGQSIRDNITFLLNATENQEWIDRLERVGFIFDEGLRGIHIPNPETGKSIIMVNPFPVIGKYPDDPDNAAGGILHTIMHELAHIDVFKGKGHNEEFAINLADIYEKVGRRRINDAHNELFEILSDPTGKGYNQEIQELLQIYQGSRGRDPVGEDLLTGTGIGSITSGRGAGNIPPNNRPNGTGAFGPFFPRNRKGQVSLSAVVNIPKATAASMDLSAPLRQGIFLMGRGAWWKSWAPMIRALKTSNYEAEMAKIASHPRFDDAVKDGLVFTKAGTRERGEEQFGSFLATNLPIIGKAIIRPSEQAYTTFLNHLRMGVYSDLMDKAERLGINVPGTNVANYVNTASGRGTMGFTIGSKTEAGERAAEFLNTIFFSPRFIASRVQLLNPLSYVRLDPFTRMEAIKDLATLTSVAGTVLGLAKLGGAEVEFDPRETDFGKIKRGNARIDVLGGFGQYIRFFSQIANGLATTEAGPDPARFIESKLSPTARLANEIARGKDYFRKDIDIPTSVLKTFAPLITQDIYQLWKQDPNLIPLAGLSVFGVPTQAYGENRRGSASGMPKVNLPKMPEVRF